MARRRRLLTRDGEWTDAANREQWELERQLVETPPRFVVAKNTQERVRETRSGRLVTTTAPVWDVLDTATQAWLADYPTKREALAAAQAFEEAPF